ncbi:nuclear transport factor 2 family protein [Glaciecola petra]|uniref:Nuclear transport factor 2 family protein n=1 Tax=Glaciecola petra TaxID=3075602 RepID=A0ABU2ZS65_9ALTE|nr:nuclear transport factor 2 family protein [Aestuariibacter sp. P117]MDT0595471.1 nuclear transport factor 2 family protein [Aestuariibacter sp. P117]
MKKLIIFVGLLIAIFAAPSDANPKEQASIISAYSAAWNAKDLAKMATLMHPDIEWLSVSGSKISVETKGKDELVSALEKWFLSPDLPKGSLRDWSINGNFVAVTETASWLDDANQQQSQSSLTVYELQDKLIRRVYYYPSI